MREILGSHVSFSKEKQMLGSVLEALSYKSNTFMFYTGAPQNTTRMPINPELTLLAHNLMNKENINIENVVVHAPYIINLANDKNKDFNISFLKEEIARVESLGVSKLVLHPGSHVGLGIDQGIQNIIDALNEVMVDDGKVIICLETMAGKGSEVGSRLEEIKRIIDGVSKKDKIGVCIDTCHLNDAGYDISDFDTFLNDFDKLIGIEKIHCVHLNDSKNDLGTHKDRHENIGYGTIGFDNLVKVLYHEKLKDVPKILETPFIEKDYPPYKFEIVSLKNKTFNSNLINEVKDFYK